MKTIVFLLVALAFCAAPSFAQDTTAATARVVVSYSDPEQIYSWCATDGNEYIDCADIACEGAGGTECTDTFFCTRAYTFIAFARMGATGMAMACDDDQTMGRLRGLSACSISSNALCWTREMISLEGVAMLSEENYVLDRATYMQLMLQVLQFTDSAFDHGITPEVDEGLRQFQSSVGLEPTALWNVESLQALLAIYDGEVGLLETIEANIGAIIADADIIASSSTPLPDRTYAEEIADYNADRLNLVLRTTLRRLNHPCADPVEVTPLGASRWDVRCDKTVYPVELSGENEWSVTYLIPPAPKVAPQKEKTK
jgi:hypothetical protein